MKIEGKCRKGEVIMKSFPQILISLLAYEAKRAVKYLWPVFLFGEAVIFLCRITGASFWSMQGTALLIDLLVYGITVLFFFGQKALGWKDELLRAKEGQGNGTKDCQGFLHFEAQKLGVHIKDRRVVALARIFFRERTIARTLLELK